MPVKTLHFDESGFTGYNLLDPDQPFFALASSDIGPAEALPILKSAFPRYQGKEFKFSNIWRSGHRTGLIQFGQQMGAVKGRVFVWMMDKRFIVLTKIVDMLIEPYMRDAGYDFYADGFCWKYTNYIHFGLVQFETPEFHDALLTAYQDFSRDPTQDCLAGLQFRLRMMTNSCAEEVRVFLEQMALGADLFLKYHDLSIFRRSSEVHVSSMAATIAYWRQRHPDDFAVVHDASSIFFRNRWLWERITNNNVPRQVHPLGDGSTVEYPLRVVGTTPVDSAENAAVQLCDILAGITTRHLDPRLRPEDRTFFANVLGAGLGEITWNGVRPDVVFPDRIPPRRRAGPDAADLMTRIIYGPHNEGRGTGS